MARGRARWPLLLLACLVAVPAAAAVAPAATGPAAAEPRPRLFLDCPAGDCDLDHLRRELAWVDWVRDRHDADVHVLVTSRGTGDGGVEARLCFLRRPGAGPAADTLRVFLPRNASPDRVRRALARALAAGLARDLVGTPQGERLELRVPPPAGAPPPAANARDPWRGWVLRTALSGAWSGERAYRDAWVSSSVAASRVRESGKVRLGASQGYSEGRYELSDGSRFTAVNRNWSASARAVATLAPRWSLGARGWAATSTWSNQRFDAGLGPALEHDFFPYAVSDRRSLTLAWELLVMRENYRAVTLYGRTRETLVSQRLVASLDLRQPWGSASLALRASHYLHDAQLFRLTAQAAADLRLWRGLSLNLSGTWERIHDQVTLPADDPTDDEIIARQRELATSHRLYGSLGLAYTFGSALNNVVNPRLEQSYGGF